MRSNSLRFRLVVSSTVVSVVLLAAAGFLLAGLFQGAMERNFDQGLRSDLDALASKADLAENGILSLTEDLSRAQYSLPLSGWYWQISPVNSNPAEGLSSSSLVKLRIDLPAEAEAQRDAEKVVRFNMTDENGKHIRVLEQRLQLFGETEFSFLVAGNFDELSNEISTFRRILFSVLGLLGAGLIGAIIFQVSFGLRPLRELQTRLSAIREGKAEKMEGDYPIEIQPVADELNLLIQSNAEVVDRARTQVGNLAHALKTPLSVLANEARQTKGALAHKVDEQTQVMRDQVSLYLDRARRAARAQTLGSVTEVEPVLQALARTLMRIHQEKGLKIDVKCPAGAKFRGERQDLEEMVGNLLDNACKWAKRRIVAECIMLKPEADNRLWLEMQVNDDGPGLPPEKWEEAMKRGRRLDETKPGSGLGLSIVTETAGMYAGKLRLGAASTGGLLAALKLPAVA